MASLLYRFDENKILLKFSCLSMDISKIRPDVLNHACKGSITESNMSAEILQRSFLEPMEL